MSKDFTNAEIWDFEGDRVIKVEKYSAYHSAYECSVYALTYPDENGDPEMSTEGTCALLTQADLESIK